jgi:phage/plasmid-associated DNA primase
VPDGQSLNGSAGQAISGGLGQPFTPGYFAWMRDDGTLDLDGTRLILPTSDLSAAQRLLLMCHEGGHPVYFGAQTRTWRIWDGSVYRAQPPNFGAAVAEHYARFHRDVLDAVKDAYDWHASQAEIAHQHAYGRADPEQAATGAAAGKRASDAIKKDFKELWKEHQRYRARIWNQPGQAALDRQLAACCGSDDALFDTGTGEIVVANGVISYAQILADGGWIRLLDHDPRRLVTRRCGPGVYYDPWAVCPVFDQFMATSVADAGERHWLLWRIANALFGRTPRKGFLNLVGETDSGKSTFTEVIHALAGSYAITVPVRIFLGKRSGDPEFGLADLRGQRVVFSHEPRRVGTYDEGLMKAITGRHQMRTADKNEKTIGWLPQCTIAIESNGAVRFDTTDAAMFGRQEPVEFARGYTVKDEHLLEKMQHELPGS